MWKASCYRLPRFYSLSHTLVENKKPICFLDVRIRKFPHNQFPTVMLPLSKILRGVEIQNATGIPFVLAVQFSDGVWYCRPGDMLMDSLTNVHIDNRNKTAKPGVMQEIEPQVMVRISDLIGVS